MVLEVGEVFVDPGYDAVDSLEGELGQPVWKCSTASISKRPGNI